MAYLATVHVNCTEGKPPSSAINALKFEIAGFVSKYKHGLKRRRVLVISKKQPIAETKQQLAASRKASRKPDDPTRSRAENTKETAMAGCKEGAGAVTVFFKDMKCEGLISRFW